MRCLGRVEGCDDDNCQKQVDVTGEEPKHVELDAETETIRDQQERKAKAKAELEY